MSSVVMRFDDKQFDVRYDPAAHAPADFLEKIAEMKKFTASVARAIRAEIEGAKLGVSARCDDSPAVPGAPGVLEIKLTPAAGSAIGGEDRPTTLEATTGAGISLTGTPATLAATIEAVAEVDVDFRVADDATVGWRTIQVSVSYHTGDEAEPEQTLVLAVPVMVQAATEPAPAK